MVITSQANGYSGPEARENTAAGPGVVQATLVLRLPEGPMAVTPVESLMSLNRRITTQTPLLEVGHMPLASEAEGNLVGLSLQPVESDANCR